MLYLQIEVIMKKVEQYQDRIARLFPQPYDGEKKLARTVTFAVTQKCSLRCTYCYQSQELHAHGHIMPFEVAKKFIDLILSYKTKEDNEYINIENSPALIIEFIGGEPLLEIDLIDKITNYFLTRLIELHHPWATKYMISICSNGTEYFKPKVQEYFNKHKHHLSFSITIDGDKELHDSCRKFPNGQGSYDIAMAAVKDWVSKGNYMGSKITVAPANVEYVYKAVKSIIENDYDDININCVFEEGWTVEHAKILYYQLKQLADYMIQNNLVESHRVAMFDDSLFESLPEEENQNWCGGLGSMLSVDYKGDIYPCIRYMENSLQGDQKPLIIGNVDEGILVNQCQKDCFHCMQSVTRRSQSTDECWNCPIAKGCAWCSAYNFQVFGTVNKRATFICIMHKAIALANVYFWNKYYKTNNIDKVFKNNVPDEWSLEIIDKDELKLLKDLEK